MPPARAGQAAARPEPEAAGHQSPGPAGWIADRVRRPQYVGGGPLIHFVEPASEGDCAGKFAQDVTLSRVVRDQRYGVPPGVSLYTDEEKGRPRTTDLREVFDAIQYMLASGCLASANNRDAAAAPGRGVRASGIIGKATDIGQCGIPQTIIGSFSACRKARHGPAHRRLAMWKRGRLPRDPDSALHRPVRASRDGSPAVMHVCTTP